MSASLLARQLTAVASSPAAVLVPARVARRADAAGWVTCDVCAWPVDPAGEEPGRRKRHPCCVCGGCDAPLADLPVGELFHPPCAGVLLRSARRRGRGRLALVSGGAR